MFKVGVAHSLTAKMATAAKSLATDALSQLDGARPNVGLLFSTYGLNHTELLAQLNRLLPDCPLLGGTSYGEVSNAQGYRLGSSLLILFASDTVKFHPGIVTDLKFNDEAHNQKTINAQLQISKLRCANPSLALLFPDGIGLDGESILRLFGDVFPKTKLFGGSTAENFKFENTLQFFNGKTYRQAVPYLLIEGAVRYHWAITEGFKSGWQPIGERRQAVCEGNWIKTIDGRPAIELLESRFRLEGGQLSVCHPIAIYAAPGSSEHYFRDMVRYSPETGAIESLQLFPERCEVQLTQPNPQAILSISSKTIPAALAHYPGICSPAVALWFSCVSRPLVLHHDPAQEYLDALSNAPANLPVAGFYVYGEIAPSEHMGDAAFHSSTLVVLVLGEEPQASATYQDNRESFTVANLVAENQALRAMLEQTRAKLTETDRQPRGNTAAMLHARTEANLRVRALALDTLCALIDSDFEQLRRHGLKGNPSRLNRLGLARLLIKHYELKSGKDFPVSAEQLARLLVQDHADS